MKPVPFYLVWAENGGEPRQKHSTLNSAAAEADRLARVHPGVRFYVMTPTISARRTDIERETFDLRPLDLDDQVQF